MEGAPTTITNGNRARPGPRAFIVFRPGMRALIEDAIESLMLLLDEIEFDAEEEPDFEDGADLEPSLGWTTAGLGGSDDREWDPAEAGIGDADGMMEQWPSISVNGVRVE